MIALNLAASVSGIDQRDVIEPGVGERTRHGGARRCVNCNRFRRDLTATRLRPLAA